MALDGKLLARARTRLAERREANEAEHDRREAEVYAAVPEIRRIDAEMRGLLGELLDCTARGETAAAGLERVQKRSEALCAEKAGLLAARGFGADYLDELVTCPVCRDSGYLENGALCACLLTLYEEEKAKELSALLRAGEKRFADFRLDYYTGEARECMELTLANARAYAERFGPDSANLLLQGGTGLGKTFLSGCIARTVSAGGHSVVYETAQEAFGAFEEQKFSRDAETYAAASEKVKRILNCELLILDDLGTELTTSFTQSALYNIINSRLTANRKTIISTNLSDAELAARYIPQIVSRINGEYETLLFMGRDIRAIRKEQRYGLGGASE